MRKISIIWLTCSCLLGDIVLAGVIDIRDDSGKIFHFSRPVQRIISLAPHITELIFIAGAGHQLVGAVDYSRFPVQARKIPRIGNNQSFDLERILRLKPDLVLAWSSGNAESGLQQLRQLGIPVFKTEVKSLADIPRLIKLFSHLSGHNQGEIEARRFNQRLQQLSDEHSHKSRVTVFYQIWDQPLMTLNSHHYISDIIRRCGGRNIIADSTLVAPTIDREYIIAKNPQVIIGAGRPGGLNQWRRWKQVEAVKNNQLYLINPDMISRPVPSILDGMEKICQFLDKARKAR